MPIPVICPCSAKLRVGDHLQGKQVKCPKCNSLIVVGSANGAGPNGPPPPPAASGPTAEQVFAESGFSEQERERLEDALEEGERLVWAGKPVPRMAFLYGWFFGGFFFFAAFICLVAIAILIGNHVGATGVVVCALLAVVFIAAGVAVPFVNRRRYERIAYAFTNRRALAWDADFLGRITPKVYGPAELTKMQATGTTAAGAGSLLFGRRVVTRNTAQGKTPVAVVPYGFFYIPNAAEVERLLREQLIDPFTDKLYE
jgi:hypothetical protein